MFTPIFPETKRPRFRTEREYREWQLSLRRNVPVKRLKNGPSFLARLVSTIHLVMARKPHPVAEPRRIEREASHLRG